MNPIKVLMVAARGGTGLERFTDVNKAMIERAYKFQPCAYGPEWKTDIAKLFWKCLSAPEADAYTAGGLSLVWFLCKQKKLLAKVVIFLFLSSWLMLMAKYLDSYYFGCACPPGSPALGTFAICVLFWFSFVT